MSPTATKFEPREVVIRHGIFWYMTKELGFASNPTTGLIEEKEIISQKIANQNETVTLQFQADYNRGVEHHAFWTEEELAAARGSAAAPAVLPEGAPGTVEAPEAGSTPNNPDTPDEPEDPTDVNMEDLDEDSDLVEWIQATGAFDGYRQPNANEVVAAAGDDKELAARLQAAEKTAMGGNARTTVESRLQKIIDKEQS